MKIKHIVLTYSTLNNKEVPDIAYFGHDRGEAMQVQQDLINDFALVELHQLAIPTKRVFGKTINKDKEPSLPKKTKGRPPKND